MTKKKRKKRQGSRLERFKRRLEADESLKGQTLVFASGDQEKMSAVLLDFIKPYRKYAKTYEAYHRLVSVALVAWNAALLPDSERQELIDNTVDAAMKAGNTRERDEAREVINELIKRKERYFATNKRFIVSYQLTETETHYYLSVASVP